MFILNKIKLWWNNPLKSAKRFLKYMRNNINVPEEILLERLSKYAKHKIKRSDLLDLIRTTRTDIKHYFPDETPD